MTDITNPNIPLIGETAEARAFRLLEERIDRMDAADQAEVWGIVGGIDKLTAVAQRKQNAILAVLYVSRLYAMRMREASNEEAAAKQRPN